MPISQKIRDLIKSAWDDGAPCLVATNGPEGPNISVKGSMVVFDDQHLAYWERSKKQALANLAHDKRVCVIYANFKAQRDGVLDSGFLRFYGTAETHESGPIHKNAPKQIRLRNRQLKPKPLQRRKPVRHQAFSARFIEAELHISVFCA